MNLPHEPGLGEGIFERLRAEHEPWAPAVFIEPDIYPLAATDQSMIIAGGEGTGKTMLRLQLAGGLNPAGSPPQFLVCHWFPEPPEDPELGGSALARYAFHQAMVACIESLLPLLGQNPALVQSASDYTRKAAAFFLREYLPGDPLFFIEIQAGEFPEAGSEALRALMRIQPERLLDTSASQRIILTMFVQMLKNFGLRSAWILVDGFENWPNLAIQRLGKMFNALWSTLAVLDVTGFIHKVFTPDTLLPYWKDAGGVITDRLQILELRWSRARLEQLVNRRLAVALGQPFTLAQFSPDPEFHAWIERQSELTPRSYLQLLSRFVPSFLAKGQPLVAEDWHPLVDYTSEMLSIDLETNQVYIGTRSVQAQISKPDLRVLLYLYQRRGRFCSKEELHFCAINQRAQVPMEDDDDWLEPGVYRDGLYNRISRLRKALNPEQRERYIATESGAGYRLINAAAYRETDV